MATTRHTKKDDYEDWQRLYEGYADYYGMPMNEQILETVWGWIHDSSNPFFCILAESGDGRIIGLAHFREMPSPLRGARVGFLDDLFVEPDARGSGAVDALFDEMKNVANTRGWPLVRWITMDDNYRGRNVYDRLANKTAWVTYQLDCDA